MKNAPHLPPHACTLKWHQRFRSLPWLLFFIVVSGLVSGATAILVTTWVVPSIVPNAQSTYVIDRVEGSGHLLPDARFQDTVSSRLILVYDKRKKISGSFYPESALVARAMVMSSDGWAVMHVPGYIPGQEAYWQGLERSGQNFSIDVVKQNPIDGLLYVKFAGTGMAFTLFPEWRNIGRGTVVWGILPNGEWQPTFITEPVKLSLTTSALIAEPQYRYQLANILPSGTILVTETGAFVGIVEEAGRVIDAFFTFEKRGNIFSGEPIDYVSLPIVGTVVDGFVGTDVINETTGFFVTALTGVATTSLRVGDVIIRIQNDLLNEQWLWRQVILAPEDVVLSVFRDGQIQSVSMKKENLVKLFSAE